MSEESYKSDSEDEYQFSDNEQALVYNEKKKSSVAAMLAQRKVWLTLAIIVVGVILYKFAGFLMGGNDKLPQNIAHPTKPLPAQSIPAIPESVKKMVAKDIPDQHSQAAANNNPFLLEKRLSDVEQHNQVDAMRLERLESKLNMVDLDFNQLQNQLNQVQHNLQAITNQLNSLQETIKQSELAKQQAAQPVKPAKSKVILPSAHYFVQAAVPGRAWLVKVEDMTTKTVAIGDELPGYGKIVRINPLDARVITSTGYTIPYKPD